MPRRTRKGRTRKGRRSRSMGGNGRRSRSMKGKGPAWDKIKRGLSKASDFLKKTKIVSKVAGELGKAGVPYADQVQRVASRVGYGKRRRRRSMK